MMVNTDIGPLDFQIITIVLDGNATNDDVKRIMGSVKADVFVVINASAAPMDLDMLYYLYFALRSHINGNAFAKDPNMEALALSQCTLQINEAVERASPLGHSVITIAALSRKRVEIRLDGDELIGSATRLRSNDCSRQTILLKLMDKY
ncbi:hypothetical protein GCM10007981_11940 [Thermocladium modestius]|uniref:Uncharacterized protein n=1 Tax=Thermocladium modestius TaxID=62609 RepID=A0A830GVP7_9CREN|nr:hypothetical protein [Thermocladium modestius]GGP21179.1 hypothetical protein GCM10007981_11940 [Thermocladium modestius]